MNKELDNLKIRLVANAKETYNLRQKKIELVEEQDEIFIDFFKNILLKIDAIKHTEIKKSIKSPLLELLDDYGVILLESPVNSMPEFSVVVDNIKDSSKNNGDIVAIKKDGYIWGTKLIQPTELIVVKND